MSVVLIGTDTVSCLNKHLLLHFLDVEVCHIRNIIKFNLLYLLYLLFHLMGITTTVNKPKHHNAVPGFALRKFPEKIIPLTNLLQTECNSYIQALN